MFIIKQLEMTSYGAEGGEFQSQLASTFDWNTVSVNPAENGYIFWNQKRIMQ